jgi:hypothetical protein
MLHEVKSETMIEIHDIQSVTAQLATFRDKTVFHVSSARFTGQTAGLNCSVQFNFDARNDMNDAK